MTPFGSGLSLLVHLSIISSARAINFVLGRGHRTAYRVSQNQSNTVLYRYASPILAIFLTGFVATVMTVSGGIALLSAFNSGEAHTEPVVLRSKLNHSALFKSINGGDLLLKKSEIKI